MDNKTKDIIERNDELVPPDSYIKCYVRLSLENFKGSLGWLVKLAMIDINGKYDISYWGSYTDYQEVTEFPPFSIQIRQYGRNCIV